MQLKGDLATRALECRLDARVERPEERSFAIDPYAEIPRRRPELVRAALTIARAYIVAGRPDLRVAPFGRFEDWAAMVRAPLIWLGLADPCASRRTIAKADPTAAELGRLLAAWEACFSSGPAAVTTAIETTLIDGTEAAALKQAMAPFAEHGGTVSGCRLGRFIAKHQGSIMDGLSFRSHGESRLGTTWTVSRE